MSSRVGASTLGTIRGCVATLSAVATDAADSKIDDKSDSKKKISYKGVVEMLV